MYKYNSQRRGTLENSGEMIGWELRELRLRVIKNNKISKSSQMSSRERKRFRERTEQKNQNNTHVTKIAQTSPGEGLSEGLRELMENSGDSARDSGELRRELGNSRDSDHSFWRTQEGTQGAPPLGQFHSMTLIRL